MLFVLLITIIGENVHYIMLIHKLHKGYLIFGAQIISERK